jgi:predicted nuclease of predicted toxin-antitoxin system
VKLLLDQNLSHRLVAALQSEFPGSTHVREHNLELADDAVIWEFARVHGFAIVSKDADFHQRSFVYGQPPKVVWLRVGNCTTEQVAATLRRRVEDLRAFAQDEESTFFIIS